MKTPDDREAVPEDLPLDECWERVHELQDEVASLKSLVADSSARLTRLEAAGRRMNTALHHVMQGHPVKSEDAFELTQAWETALASPQPAVQCPACGQSGAYHVNSSRSANCPGTGKPPAGQAASEPAASSLLESTLGHLDEPPVPDAPIDAELLAAIASDDNEPSDERAGAEQASPKCETCNGQRQVWIAGRGLTDCPDCTFVNPSAGR